MSAHLALVPDPDRVTLLTAAVRWHQAGASVLPVRVDGSKAPGGGEWKDRQTERAPVSQLAQWFDVTASTTDGLGLVTGEASGFLEMLELEGPAIDEGYLQRVQALCADNGLGEVWDRLMGGYTEVSGGKGLHVLFRTVGPARRNTKLACRPHPTETLLSGKPRTQVLLETRGEGGFVVVAPSAGRTRSDGGAWTTVAGSTPDTVPTITVEERDQLYAVITMLDEMPARDDRPVDHTPDERGHFDGLRPGDDFNERTDWHDDLLLGGAGWTRLHRMRQGWAWRRPGKDTPGLSATTGQNGTGAADRLYVFSSSTDFPTEEPLTKFWVYAELHHGGDLRAAAKALSALGYGKRTRMMPNSTDPFGPLIPAVPCTVWPVQPAGQPKGEDQPTAEGRGRGPSRASLIVQAAQQHYRIGLTLDERPFLVPHDGPNVALMPAKAKRSLSLRVSAGGTKVPSHTARDEAWGVIEAMAHQADKESLPMRLAPHNDGAVLDLGGADGKAVHITADGWRVVDRSPVTFRRPKTMLPLPEPTRGGTIDPLWGIVNVDAAHRHLFTAWLACTLLPSFPHSVVQIRGEQGSAKTTAATIMGRLADPCVAAIVGPPRDDAHWTSMAGARWVLPVDNVSHIPPWWSDALARSTTGAGDIKRALYTDDDVSAVAYKICTILNGISLTSAMRSDLAERLIPFDLRRPEEYLTEAQVEASFGAMHPAILGVLLDLAAGILKAKATGWVAVPRDLRMADMAEALACYDEFVGAHGDDGALATYRRQVADAFAEAMESDPVARALLSFMEERGEDWEGTAGELHAEISARRAAFGGLEDGAWWATSPSIFARNLPRSGPSLQRCGVKVTLLPRSSKGRIVRLERVAGDDG